MTRRKGERPIVRTVRPYDDAHPVARMIATRTKWFTAWMHQEATPYHRLVKRTGLTAARIVELERGVDQPTMKEVELLADAWFVSPADLLRSMRFSDAQAAAYSEVGYPMRASPSSA